LCHCKKKTKRNAAIALGMKIEKMKGRNLFFIVPDMPAVFALVHPSLAEVIGG
jgi:hypothetical protein